MERRRFLKVLGGFALGAAINPVKTFASLSSSASIDDFVDSYCDLWDYKNGKFKRELTLKEYYKLKEIYSILEPIVKDDTKNREAKGLKKTRKEQKREDVRFFFSRIRFSYTYSKIYTKIKKNLNWFVLDDELFLRKIDPKLESVKNKVRDSKYIDFGEINEQWARKLLLYVQKQEFKMVDIRILYAISLTENNFGNTEESCAGAIGQLQTKLEIIEEMEEVNNLKPKYKFLNDEQKKERAIVAGIYYIKHIMKILNLSVSIDNFDKIDFIILVMCYKDGIGKIMDNIGNKPFDNDAIEYARETLSILSHDMKVKDIMIAKL